MSIFRFHCRIFINVIIVACSSSSTFSFKLVKSITRSNPIHLVIVSFIYPPISTYDLEIRLISLIYIFILGLRIRFAWYCVLDSLHLKFDLTTSLTNSTVTNWITWNEHVCALNIYYSVVVLNESNIHLKKGHGIVNTNPYFILENIWCRYFNKY